MTKRVIIHFGFHKTGSSALQAFFARNVDALAEAGIYYPFPDPPSVVEAGGCSGNLVQMLARWGYHDGRNNERALLTFSVPRAFSERVREELAKSPLETALLSSEILGHLPPPQLKDLIRELSVYSIQLVGFVRDPFDFVYSCWRQIVKTTNSSERDLATYLEQGLRGERALSMLTAFGSFVATGVPLAVIRYEPHRSEVARAFFRAAGLTAIFGDRSLQTDRQVNRSLTGSEATVASVLARNFRPDFVATYIRSALLRESRVGAAFYDRSIHQRILDTFGENIALINTRLSRSEQLSTTTRSEPDSPIRIDAEDVELFLKLWKRYPPRARSAAASLRALNNRIRSGFRLKPLLPLDFDEDAYLFHNPDVASAAVDPKHHYLDFGMAEGRRYRFN